MLFYTISVAGCVQFTIGKPNSFQFPHINFYLNGHFFSGILFLMSIWLLRVILRSSTLLRSLKAMEGERGLASVGIVEENRRKIFG